MQIKFYKKIFPIVFIYNDKLVPKQFGGYNVGFINFIKTKNKTNKPLLCHEYQHSIQFWRNPIKYILGRWLKWIPFIPKRIKNWSKYKTYEFECEGYGKQLAIYVKLNGMNNFTKILSIYATWLIKYYNIPESITVEQAEFDIYCEFIHFYKEGAEQCPFIKEDIQMKK